MEKIAILIGFLYVSQNIDNHYDPERKYLPGILIDLYNMYSILKKANFDRIYVITDIYEDVNPTDLFRSKSRQVNVGILHFIKDLIDKNELCLYKSKRDFCRQLQEIVRGKSRVFMYYTGHFRNDYFIFPYDQMNEEMTITYISGTVPTSLKHQRSHAKLPSDMFIRIILKNVTIKASIVMIMDCCNGVDFQLPFVLKDGVFRLTPGKRFCTQSVLCMSSSCFNQTAVATDTGSIFSTTVYDKFIRGERKLSNFTTLDSTLNSTLDSRQTPYITCTYPNVLILERWVLYEKDILVVINSNLRLIEVTRK